MTRDPVPRGTVPMMGQDSEGSSKQAPVIGDYFFVVYRVESPNPQRRYTVPTYKYATYPEADAEARRLAEEHPGSTFAVLEVRAVRRSKAQRRRVKLKK